MPGSVTSPASLIERLPADKRSYWLQKLSANANAPGAGIKQIHRAKGCLLSRFGNLGIFPIETKVTAAQAASVGGANPPGVGTVTIDTNAGTPATTDITLSELDAITWAGTGTKTLTVTVPTNVKGEAKVTV